MSFHIGQEVICIDDSGIVVGDEENLPNIPVKGRKYTIRGFPRSDCVYLVELVNPPSVQWLDAFGEGAFKIERFRPIVKRKTSIEIFTAMLKPSKVGA